MVKVEWRSCAHRTKREKESSFTYELRCVVPAPPALSPAIAAVVAMIGENIGNWQPPGSAWAAGTGLPPHGLDVARIDASLVAVHNHIRTQNCQEELGLHIPTALTDDFLRSHIECRWIRHADTGAVPESDCVSENANAEINIHFTDLEAKECPPLLVSRLEHELTHAIRYLYSLSQNEAAIEEEEKAKASRKRNRTPQISRTETSTPERKYLTLSRHSLLRQGLWKLEDSSFHSGYLIEHALHGGIVVVLRTRFIRDPATNVVPAHSQYAKVVRVTRDHTRDIDVMECQLWDPTVNNFSPKAHYDFKGKRITRTC